MEEPFSEATLPPSSLHQTSKAGWPHGDKVWLPLPSQNGYLRVRFPHVAGSQSALTRPRRWRRSKQVTSKSSSKVGCIKLATRPMEELTDFEMGGLGM